MGWIGQFACGWPCRCSCVPGREEIFNLDKDPGELENLAGRSPQKVPEMKARLQSWLTRQRAVRLRPKAPQPSQKLLKQLRSLGYVR